MFHLTVRDHVMIAHSLPHPSFGPAQNLHGATYVVELTLWRETLSPESIVIDIGEAVDVLSSALSDLNYRNSTSIPICRHAHDDRGCRSADRGDVWRPHCGRDLSRLDVTLREHPDAWAGTA